MRFLRYAQSLAAGAAGLFTGLTYHNLSSNRHFLISAAVPVSLDIDSIISKDIEEYISQYTPLMKHGFPSYDTLRIKENFILSYDRRHRVPNWVMEHLTLSDFEKKTCASRRSSKFFEDNTIHSYFRATESDYKDSGYDKGHLAAAGNYKHCQRALNETFVMSNITPQNEYFNQGIWQNLERHVRNLVVKYGSVYVCSGPLYLPREIVITDEHLLRQLERRKRRNTQKRKLNEISKERKYVIYEVIGENNVAVPTHFFKVIVCEGNNNTYDMEAYVIPNERVDPTKTLTDFKAPLNVIERAAGLLLFPQLPPNAFRCINGEESTSESPMETDDSEVDLQHNQMDPVDELTEES